MRKDVTPAVRSEEEVRAMSLPQKEEVVGRFSVRYDAAVLSTPPSKQRIKRALARGGASRCPVRLRRLSLDVILRYDDVLADLFCEYPDDAVFVPAYDLFIGYHPSEQPHQINAIEVLTQDAQWPDEWGTVWGHPAGGVGASTVSNPLADWSQLDAYLAQTYAECPGAGPSRWRLGGLADARPHPILRRHDTHGAFRTAALSPRL